MENKKYLERLDEIVRYNRHWYFDELKDRIEGLNHLETQDRHMVKQGYEEKIDKIVQQLFNNDESEYLEDKKYDKYFNMDVIREEIETWDADFQGFEGNMTWDSAYLTGYRECLRDIKEGK